MADEKTLKDCPFCPVGKGEPRYGGDWSGQSAYAYVYCDTCGCETSYFTEHTEAEARSRAADAWNTRPASTPAIPACATEAMAALHYLTDDEMYDDEGNAAVNTVALFIITAATSSQSLRDENTVLREALKEIREIYAGSELGEPKYAQEAYAIQIVKQQYSIACAALSGKEASDG